MKRTLLFILAFLPMLASADDGDTFTEETVEGVTLTYTVISESEKTCMVGEEYEWPIPTTRAYRVRKANGSQLSGDITIPEVANGYTVIRIEAFAFEQANITSIVIPNSVKAIGPGAFFQCAALKSVKLSNQLTEIEDETFCDCVSLTSIDIPEGVTSIGYEAFYGCRELKEANIPSSVVHFGSGVFCYAGFTSMPKLPETLTTIPYAIFQSCPLTSVEIPQNIISIEGCAFNDCLITEVEIPANVTHIGVAAFARCRNLSSIVIPDNVKDIELNAFMDCSNLKTATLSNNLSSLSEGVFRKCTSLESIVIPNGVKKIGLTTFSECKSLRSISIPETVESIDEMAFYRCSSLSSIIIPNNLNYIGRGAFRECSGLTSITLGSNVDFIGLFAFQECKTLSDVYCYAENVPKTESNVFYNTNIEDIMLHVPAASISAYQAVEPWKNFKEIVALKDQENMAYRPFVEDDKVWIVRVIPSWAIPDMEQTERYFEYYYFDGDTIVNGQTAKRMFVDRIGSIWDTSGEYVGAWYEQDKKVYYAAKGKQEFELLYDFTLSTGDIIQSEDLVLQVTKMSGGIPGFKGTYYDLQYINYTPIVERWLEGVGSEYYPWLNLRERWAGAAVALLVCKAGDEIIYYNSEEEDPFSMGAKKHRFDFTHTIKTKPQTRGEGKEQSLYGEYNNLLLGINLEPLDEAYLVRITNESDQVVYEKNVNAGNIVGLNIDISAFAKGRYTVTMENSSEVFTGEFETITTGIQELINEEEIKNFNSSTLQFFNSIYNLQGQRLNRLQKGLNIVNGRKVFVK